MICHFFNKEDERYVTLLCMQPNQNADFCETLISISKLRLSRKTLISFSISTLKFSLRTLILILNSQKFSNSHSRISTINSRISEKSQPISYCGRKKCLKSRELYIALYHKDRLTRMPSKQCFSFLRIQCKFSNLPLKDGLSV